MLESQGQLNAAMAQGQLNIDASQAKQALMGKFQLGLFSNMNNIIFSSGALNANNPLLY
jgi:hypothetical protein